MDKEQHQNENVITEQATEAANDAAVGGYDESFLEGLSIADKQNDPDYDPKADEQAAEAAKEQAEAEAKEAEMAQEMTAFMAVNSFEGLLQTMAHPRFKLDDETKQLALERYRPIIAKYGPSAMGLFGQYQAEIMAGLFTVTLVRGSMTQIKELKAEDAEAARQKRAAAAANDASQPKKAA